jgi:AAA15 family ATPase/GTPase
MHSYKNFPNNLRNFFLSEQSYFSETLLEVVKKYTKSPQELGIDQNEYDQWIQGDSIPEDYYTLIAVIDKLDCDQRTAEKLTSTWLSDYLEKYAGIPKSKVWKLRHRDTDQI